MGGFKNIFFLPFFVTGCIYNIYRKEIRRQFKMQLDFVGLMSFVKFTLTPENKDQSAQCPTNVDKSFEWIRFAKKKKR